MAEGLQIHGLKELQRAFAITNKAIGKDLKAALESAADPVRRESEQLVRANISGISRGRIRWESMRVGITPKVVYVAPAQRSRNRRLRRPRFGDRLLKEMNTALDHNISKVEAELGDALDDLFRRWETV